MGFSAATSASEGPGAGAFLIGIAAGTGTRDVLSISDVRPSSRGEAIAKLDVRALMGERWASGVQLQLGASWFDFRQVFGSSGNIKDQSWVVRGNLDRLFHLGDASSAYFGAGAEYGEARSWTDTRFSSDQGPRTFFTGGSLRVGLSHAVHSRIELFGELDQSIFRAHARDGSTASDYNWLGRSFAMTLGTRVAILRGRRE